jgi:hypothetical protein
MEAIDRAVQQPVEVHGLVRAVKVADTDVDDADPQVLAPVIRLGDETHRLLTN